MDDGLVIFDDLPFVVTERHSQTPSILHVGLRPLKQPLKYRAGQYVLLSDAEGTVPQRSFSIANAPRDGGDISLLVTKVPGGAFTQDLPVGRPTLHLAAGSGLGPILTLVEAALEQDVTSEITLLFSARTIADVYYQEVFAVWEARHSNFRFLRTLTRELGAPPLGRIPFLLPRLFPDLSSFSVFIAGGAGFVEACEESVTALGVPRTDVHTEAFFAEPHPWLSPAGAGRGLLG
jgi:CDP-4-dehydro-6-deoxyglucose reductase